MVDAEHDMPNDGGRYRFLIDQLQEFVTIFRVERGMHGEIVDWTLDDCNLAAREALGRPFSELRGRSATELYGPGTMQPYFELSQRLDGTREVEKFDTYFAPVERHYSSTVFFISDQLYVVVSQDITDRKKNEEERFALQRQLHLAQKMEALGRLAGGIAHDFNNVLQPILGHVELLGQREELDADVAEGLDVIHRAANRARDLTRQILAFARQDTIEPEVVDVRPMIRESLVMMRAVLPANIQIIEEFEDDAPPALVPATGLHQVIVNLLTNAYQAMGDGGGSIVIGLSLADPPQHLRTEDARGWLRLRVQDDGPGISEEHLERIFDPFFTTKEKRHGTGLGLAVVHGVVAGFGGKLDVHSEPGSGTRFDVSLPVAPTPVPTATADGESPRAVQDKRLMFVDDEQMIVTIMKRLLERLGYVVDTYTDARAALSAFERDPDAFDAVITDMTMPTMSGIELATRMSTRRPGLPLLACSGFHDGHNKADLQVAGIAKMLIKPLEISDLAAALDELLD